MMHDASERELAYLAGIIDGEGCITFVFANGGQNLYPRLMVTNTYAPLLEWVKELTGAGTVCRPRVSLNRKQVWRWDVVGLKATEIIKALLPFLLVKRQQAETVLDYWDFVEAKAENLGSVQEDAIQKIRVLNRRGA